MGNRLGVRQTLAVSLTRSVPRRFVAGQRDDARRVIRREQIRSLSLRVSAPHLHKTVCCSLPHAVIIIWSALYRNNKPKGGAMISETQMDELADKLSGQDLELGIKAATITIETASANATARSTLCSAS